MPPTRWEASQRPLFVRTVWLSGVRHAILSQDDPARRCTITTNHNVRLIKRRAYSAPASNNKLSNTRSRLNQSQHTIEECLLNKSLESPAEDSPRPNEFTQRIYQWLEASGKVRPPTPFEGALWESPRGDMLNLNVEPLKLATKNVELNITCSSIAGRHHNNPNSASTEQVTIRQTTPGLIQTFATPKHTLTSKNCANGNRPQLHIFMPLIQDHKRRPSIDARI